ncbi:MAG: metal-dependent hydrolase [Chitinophagaceae bacterium]
MDSLTHIVLGACIGEIWLGKKIGKRSMFLGAVAQSVPDIDFIASFILPPAKDLLAHRGFTHSLTFIVLMAPLLSWLADRWRRPHDVAFRTWLGFFTVQMLVHIFLDACNIYGTGWFEPFSHYRVSFNTMFVADIFFSIVPGIVALILIFIPLGHRLRSRWAWVAISWCVCYFLAGVGFKMSIERAVRENIAAQKLETRRHFTTPVPLNNMLWYVVTESDSGYYIGYRSVFDGKNNIRFKYFPRREELLQGIQDKEEVNLLVRFSKGYYTIEKNHDTLTFNDLRFQQIAGWHNPVAPFVFHYYLQDAEGNEMVIQRGRFAGWNKAVMGSLWKRMWGVEN